MGKKNSSEAKKGLPLRARASHPKHAKRQDHKARAAKRHLRNRLANEARAAANRERRAAGLPTPWEVAKAQARRINN